MLALPAIYKPSRFADEIVLRSIDWLESFSWHETQNSVQNHEDKYEISLNVNGFAPNDIVIKTCDDLLIIEAKHDEKEDYLGYVSRHFIRKYRLAEGCKVEEMVSTLSPEGMLVVTTPRNVVKQDTIIPVTNVGKRQCFSKL